MEEQRDFDMARRFITYVRNAVDLIIEDEEGTPVSSQTLVKSGVATRKQLDILLKGGHLQAIEVEMSSILKPGATVIERAYYTERIVPKVIGDIGKPITAAKV